MDERLSEQPVDLREYLAVVKARKWTILLVTLVVAGAALFFSSQQTPMYQTTTRMLVKGVPVSTTGFISEPNLETESEIVRSEPVATLVIEELSLNLSSEALIDGLSVEPASEFSQVMEISYTSADPGIARDVPNSFANSYIEYKRERAREALAIGRESIQNRVDSVQLRLAELTERLGSNEVNNNEALRVALETERSAQIARLGVLQQRLDDFQASQPINLAGGEIIEAAVLPTQPSSPDHVRNGLLAVFLGLALGVGLAFMRERLDDRFKGRIDVVRSMGAPVLASVPHMKISKKKKYALAMEADPRGHSSEAYRSLRTGLEFISSERGFKSVLITSPSPGEGKTMTAANLAVSLAHAGRRTVLISSDLRRPTIEHYFGNPSGPGLADWLMKGDELALDSMLSDPGIPNLRLMSSGRVPPNPAELLASSRLSDLVQVLEANSDFVVFDSPPVLAVADPLILGSQVGGTVVVLDANATHRSAAIHAKTELERVGAAIVGSVLNSFDPSNSPYYYEPYSYGYQAAASEPAVTNGGGSRHSVPKKRSVFGFRR